MRQIGNTITKEAEHYNFSIEVGENIGFLIESGTKRAVAQLDRDELEVLMFFLHKKVDFDTVPNIIRALKQLRSTEQECRKKDEIINAMADRNQTLVDQIRKLCSGMEEIIARAEKKSLVVPKHLQGLLDLTYDMIEQKKGGKK